MKAQPMNPNPSPPKWTREPGANVISSKWAIDPANVGTPFNIETIDGKMMVALVNENPGGDTIERNTARVNIARRICSEHNALLPIESPDDFVREVRVVLKDVADGCSLCAGIGKVFGNLECHKCGPSRRLLSLLNGERKDER